MAFRKAAKYLSLAALALASPLRAAAPASITGTVYVQDFLGNTSVVSGALIRAAYSGGGDLVTTTADAGGYFSLTGLVEAQSPSFFTLLATAPGLADFAAPGVTTTSGTTTTWNLVMSPGVTMTGRVVDSFTGLPMAGVFIEARLQGISGAGAFAPRTTLSDGQGLFSLDHMTLGNWSVRAVRPGWEEGLASGVEANAHHLRWWRQDGFLDFKLGGFLGEFMDVASVAAADVDGDGDADLAVGIAGEASRVYLNDGSGNFSLAWVAPFSGDTRAVALADADGDGDRDLWEVNYLDPDRLYLNNGSGIFIPGWDDGRRAPSTSLSLGDVDGDGDLDMLVGRRGEASVLFENQNANLTQAWSSGLAEAVEAVLLAEATNDAHLDLILGIQHQTNRLYAGDGNGNFNSGPALPGFVLNTRGLAAGDFTGDGIKDVLEANFQTASLISPEPNVLHGGSGASFFFHSFLPGIWSMTSGLAFGDLEGDTDLDLAEANRYGTPTRVFVNNGSGSFSMWQAPQAYATQSVALADLDGDTDLDLVEGNVGRPVVVFRLKAQNAVRGIVRDLGGSALAGAAVTLTHQQGTAAQAVTSTTDASGEFSFLSVAPGYIEVTTVVPGVGGLMSWRDLGEGQSLYLTMAAKAIDGSLSGKALASPDAEVLAGAWVRVLPAGGDGAYAEASSSSSGFSFMLPAGNYFLSGEMDGFASGKSEVFSFSGASGQEQDVYLPRLSPRSDLNQAIAFPNPCRLSTAVAGVCKFAGLQAGVTVEIFDDQGRRVRRIPPGLGDGGTANDGVSGKASWDGTDEAGRRVSQGLYFYRIQSDSGAQVRGKLLLLK